VHKAPVPDDYRGPYKRGDAQAGPKYAQALDGIVRDIQAAGRGLSAFIIESVPSVGGQIILPEGYLREAYRIVRGAGGLCIADEVQTGFGRIGTHMWAFEAQRVVPDIVALGKPIGNGFPLGAVVTTPEIAASFNNGMEFFATFGGTPVACAAGMAVLDVLERDGLMDKARAVGDELLAGMRALMLRFPIIGGLMLGAELVNDRATLAPAARQASYIANRMCEKGVLIGTDGIHHNVLKVRGPMCYTSADASLFLAALESVLGEDGAQIDV
jgi:4-aminobutyrate aminotransferase-like enzyme